MLRIPRMAGGIAAALAVAGVMLFAALPAGADGAGGGGTTGDADGDGVTDASDLCPATDLTADTDGPSKSLKRNHVWSSADGFLDADGEVVFSLEDARGCSATQLIEVAHFGKGFAKHGIPVGAMSAWLARQD